MKSTTKVRTSLMKLSTTNAEDVGPWLQAHQTPAAAVQRSTSGSGAWVRTSTWSWGRRQRAWWHRVLQSRSWERTAPKAWGPTTRTTTAFTRGRWGQGSTPRWLCLHARGWWVWTRTESGCRRRSDNISHIWVGVWCLYQKIWWSVQLKACVLDLLLWV